MTKTLEEAAKAVIGDLHCYGIVGVLREAGDGWLYDEFISDLADLDKALGGKGEFYKFVSMPEEQYQDIVASVMGTEDTQASDSPEQS